EATWEALVALWPTFLSYVLSYLLTGIFWANHHHLLRFAEQATPKLIWSNLLVLFFVSLIPFFTAWLAESQLAPLPTACYAGVFLGITITFMAFQNAVAAQFQGEDLKRMNESGRKRNWIVLCAHCAAIPMAFVDPHVAIGIVFLSAASYFLP